MRLRLVLFGLTVFAFLAAVEVPQPRAAPPLSPARGKAPIFILMVWDGLRPDSLSRDITPNLLRLTQQGVRFDNHHSVYPSLTLANAASMATGGYPGTDGLTGNTLYFAPAISNPEAWSIPELTKARTAPIFLERSLLLQALNSVQALNGKLLTLSTVGESVLALGGYLGLAGKPGPVFLFNPFAGFPGWQAGGSALFASDDLAWPPSEAPEVAAAMPRNPTFPAPGLARDAFFTDLIIRKALPAAKAAAAAGRPALIVLWQRNPDLTQHHAGVGTKPSRQALAACDDNLGRLRAAIAAQGLADRVDLMVISDHGFATIKGRVALAGMLVQQGLKRSFSSDDVVVAANGGSDLIYLSPRFDRETRRRLLQGIVNFAASQEWCGPIFSRDVYSTSSSLGWIDGTFNESVVSLFNLRRSPDLFISFREIGDMDNSKLNGPDKSAFVFGRDGIHKTHNFSYDAVAPMRGVVYVDTGAPQYSPGTGTHADQPTTGMGTHGALGWYEMHAFAAAVGPDFRTASVDRSPTCSADLGPTIARLLGLGLAPGHPSGRVIGEALVNGERQRVEARRSSLTTTLDVNGERVMTHLRMERLGDELYLEGADVERQPIHR